MLVFLAIATAFCVGWLVGYWMPNKTREVTLRLNYDPNMGCGYEEMRAERILHVVPRKEPPDGEAA